MVHDMRQQDNMDEQTRSEAGRKGGQMSGGNFANDPQRASEAGRKGGQSSQQTSQQSDPDVELAEDETAEENTDEESEESTIAM